MQRKLLGNISLDFETRGQLLIIYSAFDKWEYNKAVYQLIIDLRKAYVSVRREVLYNVLIEFGIPMKLVRLINLYLTETLLILNYVSGSECRMESQYKD